MNILERHYGPEKTTHSRAAPQFSLGKSVHSQVVHVVSAFPTFFGGECSFWSALLGGTPVFLCENCTFSYIFFHFLSFSSLFFCFFLFFFSRALKKSFFLPRLPHDFLSKLLCKKSKFWAVSGSTPLGPLFFLVYFHFFFFVFFFNLFPCFPLFSFMFFFFLFFPLFFHFKKCFFVFHFVSL